MIEQKVDVKEITNLQKALESKADRFEVATQKGTNNVDSERIFGQIEDLQKQIDDHSKQLTKAVKEMDKEVESHRNQMMSTLQTKADFRDIDTLNQRMH